jgi:nicotinate-nucleotide adenylyltransferase
VTGPRIGVLGGTFDPVHIGHLVTAVEVRHALALDVVMLVVAASPWQKIGTRPITPAADRLAVVEAAITGAAGLDASALEMERDGPTYTADTLRELLRRHLGAELFLIVGSDVASELDTWMRVDEVRNAAHLVVVQRPGREVDLDALRSEGWRIDTVPVPALDVSSTDLRLRFAEGRPVDFLIPAEAVRVIRERGLYPAGR